MSYNGIDLYFKIENVHKRLQREIEYYNDILRVLKSKPTPDKAKENELFTKISILRKYASIIKEEVLWLWKNTEQEKHVT